MAEQPGPHEDERAAEALLRAARPAPSLVFSGELERELFATRRRWREHPAIAGLAGATALASAFLGFSLAGGGPLASTGGSSATADEHCRTVYVTKVEQVGELVRKPDGTVTVETTREPVTREVERCEPN